MLPYTTATPTTTPSPTPSQWPTTTSTPGQFLSNWIFFSGITEVCSSREIFPKKIHQTNFCLKGDKIWLRQNIGFIGDLRTCEKRRQIIAFVLISTLLLKSLPWSCLVVLNICQEFWFLIRSVLTSNNNNNRKTMINVTNMTFIIFGIRTICYHAIVFTDYFIIALIVLTLAVKNTF